MNFHLTGNWKIFYRRRIWVPWTKSSANTFFSHHISLNLSQKFLNICCVSSTRIVSDLNYERTTCNLNLSDFNFLRPVGLPKVRFCHFFVKTENFKRDEAGFNGNIFQNYFSTAKVSYTFETFFGGEACFKKLATWMCMLVIICTFASFS